MSEEQQNVQIIFLNTNVILLQCTDKILLCYNKVLLIKYTFVICLLCFFYILS
jgi:hypothetical protein